jgi:glycine cleavage system H protein
MSEVPNELHFTAEHEWVAGTEDPNIYRIGITDFAQSALGDIVYIQLPKKGLQVSTGVICGEIESTKSVSEIYSPLTGEVVRVNESLEAAPERINSDSYGAGWIAEIKITGPLPELMSAEKYRQITA